MNAPGLPLLHVDSVVQLSGARNMNATPPGTVTTQAIEWHQRLKQGAMDAATRAQFRDWMRSPAHVEELARICLIDASLGSLKGKDRHRSTRPAVRPSLRRSGNVIHLESYAPVAAPRTQPPVLDPARLKSRISAAASVLFAVTASAIVTLVSGDRVIMTREGSWDKQLLADGTRVFAGPRTKLRMHFDNRTRAVKLLQGEALFEVARQPERPFVVSTNAGRVQALGTSFATAETDGQVIVTVVKGRVAVSADNAPDSMVPLAANQQLVLSAGGAGEPVMVNAERALKWVRDWYEYDGEQVGEIIAALNQRHASKIIVDDPRIMRLRMNSLAFQPSRPEDFVAKINRWYAGDPQNLRQADPRRGGVLHLQRT